MVHSLPDVHLRTNTGFQDNSKQLVPYQPPRMSSTMDGQLPMVYPSQDNVLLSLLEALVGSFGLSTGLLLFFIGLFVWKFRSYICAYLADWYRLRNYDRDDVQYELIYVCSLHGNEVTRITSRQESVVEELVDLANPHSGSLSLLDLTETTSEQGEVTIFEM